MAANFLSVVLTGVLVVVSLQPSLGLEVLNSVCLPTSSNFTSPTQYSANVKTLLKLLTSRSTLASTGFSKGSSGKPNTQQAFGLINCRPDISSSDCEACGHQATKDALSLCSLPQGAILWYDSCLLKYSDSDFLGSIDTQNQFTMSSPVRVSGDTAQFSSRVEAFLTKLSNKAASDPTLFAKGKTKADSNTTVYGLVQCTRDLSSRDCATCLQEAVGDFGFCCDGVQGGRVIAASCMFRFEIYPF